MRNLGDNRQYNYCTSESQRSPAKTRNYDYQEQNMIQNDRNYSQSSLASHVQPCFLMGKARKDELLLNSKSGYSFSALVSSNDPPAWTRNNGQSNFLRQTYDASYQSHQKESIAAYSKEYNSSKFLRNSLNGNIDDYLPKKQLAGPCAAGYSYNTTHHLPVPTASSQALRIPLPNGSSYRTKYKIDDFLLQKRSNKRLAKCEQIDPNVKRSDKLKRYKYQRKVRKDAHNENAGLDDLRSIPFNQKPDTQYKNSQTFAKKNYYEYYTPELNKTSYGEKSRHKDFETQPNLKASNSPLKSAKQANALYCRSPDRNKNLLKYTLSRAIKFTIDDFDMGKCLGQGKFGSVHIARHMSTNSLFAVKRIPKSIIKEHLMVDQFLKEVKLQSFMDHRNVLRMYGVCDDTEHLYLILQYMQEGTLFRLLKESKVLREDVAAIYLRQVAEAVCYIHESGIAHRDIKPENIVMTNGICKLCDFGWATVCSERRKTYCGTFDYAAPEILEGIQYDMSVDLWCLGVLAYELMVGKAPFYHSSRKETMKRILNVDEHTILYPDSLSKEAASFIQGLVLKNPDERMRGQALLSHPFLKDAVQDLQ